MKKKRTGKKKIHSVANGKIRQREDLFIYLFLKMKQQF